jgi:Holliday junction resolvase RusA-like endonuclease
MINWSECRLGLTPFPASRPRMTKAGFAYTEPKYKAWKSAAINVITQCIDAPPSENLVALRVQLISVKPRTGKLVTPNYDTDNGLKSIQDAITQAGRIWNDDRQIVWTEVMKGYGNTNYIHLEWAYVCLEDLCALWEHKGCV